jgi:hypothetical protein
MSGKGAHINVLGERIRRYYEHLMTDAHSFVDELRKDLEGSHPPQISADRTDEPERTHQTKPPVRRSH